MSSVNGLTGAVTIFINAVGPDTSKLVPYSGATGGVNLASNGLTAGTISAQSVTSASISANGVTAQSISSGPITASTISAISITTSDVIVSGKQSYGQIYGDNQSYTTALFTVSLPTSGSPVAIGNAALSSDISSETTLSTVSGTITVLRSGVYRMSFSVSYLMDSSNIVTHFSVFKNGIELTASSLEEKNINSTDVNGISKSSIASLSANDVLDIRADCNSNSRTLSINHYNFNVYRLV